MAISLEKHIEEAKQEGRLEGLLASITIADKWTNAHLSLKFIDERDRAQHEAQAQAIGDVRRGIMQEAAPLILIANQKIVHEKYPKAHAWRAYFEEQGTIMYDDQEPIPIWYLQESTSDGNRVLAKATSEQSVWAKGAEECREHTVKK